MHDNFINTDMSTAKNIIYTGVAGTGKTYQLLQIAKQYSDYLPALDHDTLVTQLLDEISWREVICLIFLDLKAQQQELVKVPEILVHEFFVAKAAQNARDKNLSNTAWSVLQIHSPADSQTVTYKNRASQAYFDKDESGAWYLLPKSIALLDELAQQLADFRQTQRDTQALSNEQRYNKRFSMVSFHQAYGYEEFVEGIRPLLGSSQSNQMRYDIQDGAFLQLCQRAAHDPEHRYAMLIDEINRANVSRVFGEMLSLIEPDKRAGLPNAMQINLAYSGRAFSVPANVDIYATMNTQDHSLAPLDIALRRRFRFIDCPPRSELLSIITATDYNLNIDQASATIDLAQLLTGLNNRITQVLGQEAQLGHAFLITVQDLAQLQTALVEQIIPQLAQMAGGQLAILQYLFNDETQPLAKQFIQDNKAAIHAHSNSSIKAQANVSGANPAFMSQNIFAGQALSFDGYTINPELIARTGEFAKFATYQRLY